MEVWCVCLEEGEEGKQAGRQEGRACGGRELTPFVCMCGRVLLRAGWRRVAVTPVCPGKQCPRRVFYGSCWTLISFVPRLSRAAAALSPPAPPPPSPATLLPCPPLSAKSVRLPPHPRGGVGREPRTTRYCVLAGVRNRLPHNPRGAKCVTNQSGKNKN